MKFKKIPYCSTEKKDRPSSSHRHVSDRTKVDAANRFRRYTRVNKSMFLYFRGHCLLHIIVGVNIQAAVYL